jgi:hypothetical protein
LAFVLLRTLVSLVAANPCEEAEHRQAKGQDEENVHNRLCKNSVDDMLQLGSSLICRSLPSSEEDGLQADYQGNRKNPLRKSNFAGADILIGRDAATAAFLNSH